MPKLVRFLQTGGEGRIHKEWPTHTEVLRAFVRVPISRLAELESIVERGLATFVEVGNALLEIRNSRLYRPDFINFKEYCSTRWEMSRPRAYQLIEADWSPRICLPSVDIKPTSERQVRPLTKLESDQQREAWKMATASNV